MYKEFPVAIIVTPIISLLNELYTLSPLCTYLKIKGIISFCPGEGLFFFGCISRTESINFLAVSSIERVHALSSTYS